MRTHENVATIASAIVFIGWPLRWLALAGWLPLLLDNGSRPGAGVRVNLPFQQPGGSVVNPLGDIAATWPLRRASFETRSPE